MENNKSFESIFREIDKNRQEKRRMRKLANIKNEANISPKVKNVINEFENFINNLIIDINGRRGNK